MINILMVVVPILLLGGGIYLSTGPFWDVLMLVGIGALVVHDFKMYSAVRDERIPLAQARYMVVLAGTMTAIFALGAQANFCHLHGAEHLLAKASMVWMFILISISLISELINGNRPNNVAIKWSIILGTCWISIWVIAGMLDFYEYFSGQEIPQRLGDILGMFAMVSAIGCIVLMIVGIIRESFRR